MKLKGGTGRALTDDTVSRSRPLILSCIYGRITLHDVNNGFLFGGDLFREVVFNFIAVIVAFLARGPEPMMLT